MTDIEIAGVVLNTNRIADTVLSMLEERSKQYHTVNSLRVPRKENLPHIFTPELMRAKYKKFIQDDSVSRHTHYPDCPAYTDPQYPGYNMNHLFGNFIAAQGPFGKVGLEQFLKAAVFPEKGAVGAIMTIGADLNGEKFYPYVGQTFATTDFVINSCATVPLTKNLQMTSMTFTEKATGQAKTLAVYSLPKWGDHQANMQFNDTDFDYLRIIYKTHLTATHCSAGLGRAGTIAFLVLIASEFKSLQKIVMNMPANASQDRTEEAIAKKLFLDLVALREKRPGLIQNSDQLKLAINSGLRAGDRQVMLESAKNKRHIRSTSGQQQTTTSCRTFHTEMTEPKQLVASARFIDIRVSM